VSDPSAGCKVIGIDDSKRRSQTDLIDFVRSQHFAGDIRPEIEFRTICIDGKSIDILIVFHSTKKPFYLRKDYRHRDKCIRANYIYTRNIDTNTPLDQGADISFIESMWRERFGLDIQPSERMVDLLRNPHEWDKDIGNNRHAYHKFHPEYQVEFCEVREFKDIFSYFYINDTSYIGEAKFKYLTTELFSLPYMYCDEMRVALAVPDNGYLRHNNGELWYMYYILDSRNGAFLNFMTNSTFTFHGRIRQGGMPYLMYRNTADKSEFEHYLSNNIDKLNLIPHSEFAELTQSRINESGQQFVFNPIQMDKITTLHEQWRFNKDSLNHDGVCDR
jgi:hypothetical protein